MPGSLGTEATAEWASSPESGGRSMGTQDVPRQTVGIAFSGRRDSREGEGAPVISYLAPFPLPFPCLGETSAQQIFSLE